jgi:hypothetical protein
MPLLPQGAAMRVNPRDAAALGTPPSGTGVGTTGAGAAGPAAQNTMEVQFPSATWFPVAQGDRLEIRVATYGPYRHVVRWTELKSAVLRPDLHTVTRTFYYMGAEIAFAVPRMSSTAPKRVYSVEERYTWALNAPWDKAAGITYPKTAMADVYDAPSWVTPAPGSQADLDIMPGTMKLASHQLVLERDQMAWTIPTGPEGLKLLEQGPLDASVTGQARFMSVVRDAKRVTANTESGRGTLRVRVEPW